MLTVSSSPPDQRDEIILAQQRSISELTETVEKLRGEIAELRKLLFGQSRERMARMPTPERALSRKSQPDPATREQKRRQTKTKRKKARAKRKELPVVDVPHDIDVCPHCDGKDLRDLNSPEVSEEIEFVPAHFMRKRHLRAKKKCNSCKQVSTAEPPARVSDGCHYGPGVHAHTVVSKCADSIPIYRQSKRYAREGVHLPRSTIYRMFHRCAELLEPVAERILELIVESERVNADETPIKIQAPEKCDTGYIWTFLATNKVAYRFSPSRSGETPEQVLNNTTGWLQVDGYTGYNIVCVPEGRTRVGCTSHARRKFFNALETAPVDAQTAMDHILGLYEVEYEAARQGILGTAKHLALRRAQLKDRLDAMESWMKERSEHHPPKSPMGKALSYALKMWPSMQALLEDPKLRLDNNMAENALRLIALGRKNFLFVGDNEGGENLATLQTIVSTCVANEVNPEAYIADVLLRLDDTSSSEIDRLLPWNWAKSAEAT